MKNYYLLSWKHKRELASAFALQETKLDHELIPQLEGKNFLQFDFELQRIRESNSGLIIDNNLMALNEVWQDYQPNNLAWPLMSDQLRSVITNNLTGKEQVDWIACKIRCGSENRPYFILRFNAMLDVLDTQKTIFVQGTDHIIKPVFSLSKISQYSIFPKPLSHNLWKITPGIYVSETIKKAIQKHRLTGLDFEKVVVS